MQRDPARQSPVAGEVVARRRAARPRLTDRLLGSGTRSLPLSALEQHSDQLDGDRSCRRTVRRRADELRPRPASSQFVQVGADDEQRSRPPVTGDAAADAGSAPVGGRPGSVDGDAQLPRGLDVAGVVSGPVLQHARPAWWPPAPARRRGYRPPRASSKRHSVVATPEPPGPSVANSATGTGISLTASASAEAVVTGGSASQAPAGPRRRRRRGCPASTPSWGWSPVTANARLRSMRCSAVSPGSRRGAERGPAPVTKGARHGHARPALHHQPSRRALRMSSPGTARSTLIAAVVGE